MNLNMNYVLIVLFASLSSLVSSDDPKIIIIGAGPAGIATASHLLSNNFNNVKILEAENRIGGRIYSVHFGKANIDLGAQWCQGEKGNIVYELVKNLDLLETSIKPDKFSFSTRYEVDKEFTRDLYNIFEKVNSDGDFQASKEQTLGEYFIDKYNETISRNYAADKEKLKVAQDALDYFHLENLGLASAKSWFDCAANSQYEPCEGELLLNWKDKGYKILLDVLAKKYPNENESLQLFEKVSLNKEVNQIKWTANTTTENVKVTCTDGSVYSANHVIFTPSIGVLKEKANSMFYPSLPDVKKSAIEKIGIGAVFKAFVSYSEPWWTGSKGFRLVWDPQDLKNARNEFPEGPELNGRSWVTYLYSILLLKVNPNILEIWITGPLVPEIEIMSEEVFLKGVSFVTEKFFGHLYNITQPDKVKRSKWYNNPHFNGTYSYRTVASNLEEPPSVESLAAPLLNTAGIPVVQFAGEATNPSHFSTVHGAVETGFREARRLIQHYKSKKLFL